jgi:hypothetical protein
MEALLTILFLAGAAIVHSWLKKKQEKEADTWLDDTRSPDDERHSPSRRAPAQPRPQPTNWEEELRRFLEGERSPPAAPPQSPAPPPLIRPEPVVTRIPAPSPPPLVFQPASRPAAFEQSDEGEGLPIHMPELSEAARAFERASQIEAKVGEQLRQATRTLITHRPALQGTSARRVAASDALVLFKHPQSLKAAIVASVVLGPPRALES